MRAVRAGGFGEGQGRGLLDGRGGHGPDLAGHAEQGAAQPAAQRRELMRLIAAGHTNARIARQLGITEGTVRSHLEDIYARLQVSNRAAAVARAFPAGAPMQPLR